jgi:hypothetical protein
VLINFSSVSAYLHFARAERARQQSQFETPGGDVSSKPAA